MTTEQILDPRYFDLGHQGDFDYTQIAGMLQMSPSARLKQNDGWRWLLMRPNKPMPNFLEDTVVRLAQAQVEFVIVGGASAVLQGVPIVTKDLDICYRRTPTNMTRLAEALAPLQPRLRGLPPDLPFVFDERALQLGTNFTLLVGNEELDLLAEMSAIGGYEQIIGQAQELMVGSIKAKVLSLSQLIATKEAAGRLKDLAVVPLIRATLEFKEKQKASGNEPPASP